MDMYREDIIDDVVWRVRATSEYQELELMLMNGKSDKFLKREIIDIVDEFLSDYIIVDMRDIREEVIDKLSVL